MLTIIVTTSVVRSNPDLFVITSVLASLAAHICNDRFDLIVVYDGALLRKNDETRFKSARVSRKELDNYLQFTEASQAWIRSWHSKLVNGTSEGRSYTPTKGTTDVSDISGQAHITTQATSSNLPSLTFIECSTRFGFALAVKHALPFVTTEYVLVNQHDWEFNTQGLDFSHLLDVMSKDNVVKYISFSAKANKAFLKTQWCNRDLPPIHCNGGNSWIANNACEVCIKNKHCKMDDHTHYKNNSFSDSNGHLFTFNGLEFIRCHFWYDKPHLVSVATYNAVFALGLMKRGDFIEDVYGHHLLDEIKKDGISACEKSGCWILWDELCRLRHLNGRGFLTETMKDGLQLAGCTSKRTACREKRIGQQSMSTARDEVVYSSDWDVFDTNPS